MPKPPGTASGDDTVTCAAAGTAVRTTTARAPPSPAANLKLGMWKKAFRRRPSGRSGMTPSVLKRCGDGRVRRSRAPAGRGARPHARAGAAGPARRPTGTSPGRRAAATGSSAATRTTRQARASSATRLQSQSSPRRSSNAVISAATVCPTSMSSPECPGIGDPLATCCPPWTCIAAPAPLNATWNRAWEPSRTASSGPTVQRRTDRARLTTSTARTASVSCPAGGAAPPAATWPSRASPLALSPTTAARTERRTPTAAPAWSARLTDCRRAGAADTGSG